MLRPQGRRAEMAESADAADLKSAIRENVRVQVPFSAPLCPDDCFIIRAFLFLNAWLNMYVSNGIDIYFPEVMVRYTALYHFFGVFL